MWDRLIPKEYGFFDLFERHAGITLEAATALVDLMEQWPASGGKMQRIVEQEHECDSIVHMTVDLLHKTFIVPVDRDEILSMISGLDDIMDSIESVAQRMILFEIEAIPPHLLEMARVLHEAMNKVAFAIRNLRGFKRVAEQRLALKEIRKMESEGDRLLRVGLGELFHERAADPLTVMKLKEIYETVENSIDQCEDIANIVEGVILEYS